MNLDWLPDLPPETLILLGAGLVALVLLMLMLRFALRPKRKRPPKQRGVLDLDVPRPEPVGAAGPAGAGGNLFGQGQATSPSARAAGPGPFAGGEVVSPSSGAPPVTSGPGVLSANEPEAYRSSERPYAVEPAPVPVVGREGSVPVESATASGADLESLSRIAAESRREGSECPKCGGRFLQGEMEGPTLMVDGVGREDFQPLLTARECSGCGYLEFYTRGIRT